MSLVEAHRQRANVAIYIQHARRQGCPTLTWLIVFRNICIHVDTVSCLYTSVSKRCRPQLAGAVYIFMCVYVYINTGGVARFALCPPPQEKVVAQVRQDPQQNARMLLSRFSLVALDPVVGVVVLLADTGHFVHLALLGRGVVVRVA